MLDTSQSFYNNSVYKYRNTKSEITIRLFDNTAKGDIVNVSNNGNKFFFDFQVYDDIETAPKYATGEKDEFKLDGSMELLPNRLSNEQIGWWSLLSKEDGTFATNPKITIRFNDLHTSLGATVFYDEFSYPIESICRWFSGDLLIGSMKLTDQNSNIQIFDKGVEGYDKVEIEIIKAKPLSFIKMLEIHFGVIMILDETKTQGMSINEKTSLMCNTIESNELNFNLVNYDGKYEVYNPESLQTYFKQGQECVVQSGVLNRETNSYEFIPMGKFYIEDKKVSNGVFNIKAFGELNLLNKEKFKSPMFNNEPMENIIALIMGDHPYYIHDNLKGIKLSGYIPLVTKKEALKYVLIACGGVVKEGRDGIVYFFRPTEDLSTNQIVVESSIYERYGQAGLLQANIDPIAVIVKPKPYIITVGRDTRLGNISTSNIGYYNRFDLEYLTYTLEEESKKIKEDDYTTDTDGHVLVDLKTAFVADSIECDCEYEVHASCIELIGEPETTYHLKVMGKKYIENPNVMSSILDEREDISITKQTMTLDKCNNLITTSIRAKTLADWYLGQLRKANDVSFEWWSVATTEPCDFIYVMTRFNEKVQMQISEIEYNLVDLVAKVKGIQ